MRELLIFIGLIVDLVNRINPTYHLVGATLTRLVWSSKGLTDSCWAG